MGNNNKDYWRQQKTVDIAEDGDIAVEKVKNANAFEEDRKAAFEARMNDHITKPISRKKLKDVPAKFLK